MSISNEDMARSIKDNPQKLLKRLNDAKNVLYPHTRKKFDNAIFNFEMKRLIGKDRYYLQFKLRYNEFLPESYDNQ